MSDFHADLHKVRERFNSGVTRPHAFRRQQLLKLKAALLENEDELMQALYDDLRKSREESWVTEIGFVIAEINHALRNLREWMEVERVPTNLLNFPSKSYIHKEPLGVVLIVGPWNYPFQLLINPLVGAIAAGNCVVLKPSEFASATAKAMSRIISTIFDRDYVFFVEGPGHHVIPQMMNSFRFDHVFYTGSPQVGTSIYEMAAKKLVPVTLELGGKSPCVVESDADIKVAAKRIALTKFSNAGQMCVAPDYLLLHTSIKEKFIDALIAATEWIYKKDASENEEYGRIINERQFQRLQRYMQEGRIIHGGMVDESKMFVSPTMITGISPDSPLLKEEIFGPVLPILEFSDFDEAKSIIHLNPQPLSFYLFTSNRTLEEKYLREISFGGGCINNASWHLTNYNLPFGGRGGSGIGSYHGKSSFDVFTHRKAIMKTPAWFDPSIKYPPYKGKLRLFKWLVK